MSSIERAKPQLSGKSRRSIAPFPPTHGTRESNASPATCPGTKLYRLEDDLCRAISGGIGIGKRAVEHAQFFRSESDSGEQARPLRRSKLKR